MEERELRLIGSDPHKIGVPINKSQFKNILQTSTDFQIAFLEYFVEISFHYPSNKLWNFLKNTGFIISHIVISQPIPQTDVFYIDGTKNAKASFWSLKEYKIFYSKFHSAQQNELDALIQVIHLRSYPINIVSDSLYSVFVLRNTETSTIKSNQSIIQQLFLELQLLLRTTLPPFIFSSVQFSHSAVSDSLQPHKLQHARLSCSSLTPGVHSNSCPSSW